MTNLDQPHRSRRYCVDPSLVLSPDQRPPSTGVGVVFDWLGKLIGAVLIVVIGLFAILFFPVALIPVIIIVGLIVKASRRSTEAAVQRAVRQELDRRDALAIPNAITNTKDAI